MLKASQVPIEVRNAISAARKGGASSAEIATAAINAWPGLWMHPYTKNLTLPMPQETRDE